MIESHVDPFHWITIGLAALLVLRLVELSRRAARARERSRESALKLAEHLEHSGFNPAAEREMKFFLCFDDESKAQAAAADLADKYVVTISNRNDSWLCLACRRMPMAAVGLARKELEKVARRHKGTYDGWEA